MQVKLFLLCRVRQGLLLSGTGRAELQDWLSPFWTHFQQIKLMHPRELFPLGRGLSTVKTELGMAEGTSSPDSLCSVLCCAAVVFASQMQLERWGLWRLWTLPHPPQGTFKQ